MTPELRRIWPAAAIYAIAVVTLVVGVADSASAGLAPPHEHLRCQFENGGSVSIRNSRENRNAAYTPNQGERIITFNENVFYRRPPAIGKLEFANACLTVVKGWDFASQPREVMLCDSIEFLDRQGAFSGEDLDQLEQFTYSREAEITGYNGQSLKSAFACFYR